MRIILNLACLAVLCPQLVLAHEFWLAPRNYQVEIDAQVQVDIKNGEMFEGINLPYFPKRTQRFEWVQNGTVSALGDRTGDIPALAARPLSDGLLVIAHETTAQSIRYNDWEKFARFAAHKDFANIGTRHDARGLSRDRVRETYTRHAKTMIAVGAGTGSDQALGLEVEFVALANPYTTDLTALPVRLIEDGAPRKDAQIEVFERAPDGRVSVFLLRTDEDGEAAVPVMAGHEYLLDAVSLRLPTAEAEADWHTSWAALTFAIP